MAGKIILSAPDQFLKEKRSKILYYRKIMWLLYFFNHLHKWSIRSVSDYDGPVSTYMNLLWTSLPHRPPWMNQKSVFKNLNLILTFHSKLFLQMPVHIPVLCVYWRSYSFLSYYPVLWLAWQQKMNKKSVSKIRLKGGYLKGDTRTSRDWRCC